MTFREFVLKGVGNYDNYAVVNIPPDEVINIIEENPDIFSVESFEYLSRRIRMDHPEIVSMRFESGKYQSWADEKNFYGTSSNSPYRVSSCVDYSELDFSIPNIDLTALQSLM